MISRSAFELTEEEIIMFYNIENFFQPDVKPLHRTDPVFSGLRNWDERKFRNKLNKTEHVFQLIKEEYGVLPMLMGLSEIQGESVLNEIAKLPSLEGKYGIIHYKSMDERGVDVALLYDKSKIEILESDSISYFFEIVDEKLENYDATRDILYCRISMGGVPVHLYVCHLPSKRENDINRPKRNYILRNLRERIEQNLSGTGEAVMVMGDFNENPDEENIRALLQDSSMLQQLHNPFAALFAQQMFSTFHFKSGLLFDQILLSKHFFDSRFPIKFEKADVFNREKLSSRDHRFKGRPFRTYAGTRYLGGYSDHFPVLIKLIKN